MQKQHQEIIEFARELVRIKSQGEIDGEKNIVAAVFNKLKDFGFKPKLIGDKSRPSLICEFKKGGKKTIWMESCLDTVPAGDISKWDYPPFEGKIINDRMFGRGAADAKIGIALFVYLAKQLSEDEDFCGNIFLGFDADEQAGNFSGIKEIVKVAPRADICILGYQGLNEIAIGARGWLRLKMTVFGKSAHTGSRNNRGVNAIHGMAQAIDSLLALSFHNKNEPFFEFGSSFNFSLVEGGAAINIVPDVCTAFVEIRSIPSQAKKEIISLMKGAIDKTGIEYELKELQYEPAYITNPQNRFVRILKENADNILNGNLPLVASGPGSVGNVISKLGVPIINSFGVDCGNVHAPNEWINIETVPKVFEIYKKSIIDYCKN